MQRRSQSLTTRYGGIARALQNNIHVGAAFDPSTRSGPVNPQNCNAREFVAIWDTDATNTVVSQAVAQQCGLKPIGIVKVNTANGERLSEVYLVSIFLPNRVFFPQLRVTEGTLLGADVLIGMDIITRGGFAVTNVGGRTTFSYRWPSTETIDFVRAGKTVMPKTPQVGRNDPCPCGSGKKYKRCCGK